MKPHEIRELFPISVEITEDIINSSIKADRNNCIASIALKTILPEELHSEIDWGTGIGRIMGVPIRSKYKDEKGDLQDAYLQFANIKPGILITFIVDNR